MPPRRVLKILCALALVAGILVSCAEPPADRVRATRASFTELKEVDEAERWAEEEMRSAAGAMDAAEKEYSAQNARLSFRRDYTKAIQLLVAAQADIDLTRQVARAEKAAREKSAHDALDATLFAIDRVRTTLMIAPVSRDSRAAVDRLEGDLGKAEESLEEVRRLIVDEKFRDAEARAEEILDKVTLLSRSVGRTLRK